MLFFLCPSSKETKNFNPVESCVVFGAARESVPIWRGESCFLIGKRIKPKVKNSREVRISG
jgi:hypothetical protein